MKRLLTPLLTLLLCASCLKDYTPEKLYTLRNNSGEIRWDPTTHELVYGTQRYKMLPVEGGTFHMGADYTGPDASLYRDEMPPHPVTLTSYYIGETEVTQALWKAVMKHDLTYAQGDNLPQNGISWKNCQAFIDTLNALTGLHFRLPTEAEWEYAARGGSQSRGHLYSGSDNLDEVAWYESSDTHPVATKKPNELGLYDMTGNVEEWCQDLYGPYDSLPQTNPTGPAEGTERVIRGGGVMYPSYQMHVTHRSHAHPGTGSFAYGLRLVIIP